MFKRDKWKQYIRCNYFYYLVILLNRSGLSEATRTVNCASSLPVSRYYGRFQDLKVTFYPIRSNEKIFYHCSFKPCCLQSSLLIFPRQSNSKTVPPTNEKETANFVTDVSMKYCNSSLNEEIENLQLSLIHTCRKIWKYLLWVLLQSLFTYQLVFERSLLYFL